MFCRQFWSVSAFATAEEFRLEKLYVALAKTNVYEPTCLYKGSDEDESGELIKSTFLYCLRNLLSTNIQSGVGGEGNPCIGLGYFFFFRTGLTNRVNPVFVPAIKPKTDLFKRDI